MVNRICALVAAWLALSCNVIHAASLEATVSATSVVDGESVALYLEGTDLTETPDVSALYPLFDILDSRTSEQVSIINGARTNKNIWRFELMAKSAGNIVIPSFTADGVSTDPIVITVQQRGAPGAVPRDNIFFELSVDTAEPWVQSQVVLTVSVFDGANIASGSLSEPEADDLQIERLPDLPQQIVERDGVEYRLITRRYALFPQRSGEIVISPLQLSANIRDIDTNSQRRYSQNRRVTIRSDSLTLNVKPRPSEATAAWWLPVAEINLTSEWSGDITQSVVGEPLTRTLVLTALGAVETQLPEIAVPAVDGLKIYPDAPLLDTEALDTGLVSARQEKWSIIPQRAGELTLPPITIKWWDTTHDAERETVLPAEVVVVAAAAGDAAAAGPEPTDTAVATDVTEVAAPTPLTSVAVEPGDGRPAVRPDAPGHWMWLAIIALIGWLATIAAWWLQRRRGASADAADADAEVPVVAADALLKQVVRAAERGDARQFRTELLRWAARQWPLQAPLHPADVGRRLGDEHLQVKLAQLDASIYSANPVSVDLPPLCAQLREALARDRQNRPRDLQTDPLPQL